MGFLENCTRRAKDANNAVNVYLDFHEEAYRDPKSWNICLVSVQQFGLPVSELLHKGLASDHRELV